MIVPIFSVFILASVFSIFGRGTRIIQNVSFFLLLIVVLVLIATFRPSEMPDYKAYAAFFRGFTSGRFEFVFVKITSIIRIWTKEPLYFFAFFAFLSISIKLLAIRRMSPFVWLSLAIYISNIYILHDMIQIRCAIASGLLLWALKYIYDRNLIRFLCVTVLAVSFHTSALVIFPFWFIDTRKLHKKLFMCLIPLSYLLALSGRLLAGYVQYIDIDSVQNLFSMYELQMKHGGIALINIFNTLHLFRCFICLFLWVFIERLVKKSGISLLFLKVYTIALVSFVVFSDIPVIAFRISEFLLVVEIILIPMLVYVFKDSSVFGKLLPIAIGAMLLLINTFVNHLI